MNLRIPPRQPSVIALAQAAPTPAPVSPLVLPLAPSALAFVPNGQPWEGWRQFTVARRIDEADGQVTFDLKPSDGQAIPGYKAGQFLHVRVTIGDEVHVRHYSLSDAQKDDFYRITIKRALPPEGQSVPAGKVSSYFLDNVQVGALVDCRPPKGRFVLDAADTTPVVMLAGGIGVTPFLAMVNELGEAGSTRPVHLYYACSKSTEIIRRGELRALAAKHPNIVVHLVVSKKLAGDKVGDYDHVGRIGMDLLKQTLPEGTYEIYLCGPQGMMADLTAAFLAAGVEESHIHSESFGSGGPRKPRTPPSGATPAPVSLSFVGAGRAAWSPSTGSLLAVPRAANTDRQHTLSVPFSGASS